MIFALAGNQNCGKTTLFNQLTGSNQHVGNFPGVTVDQKSGAIRGEKDCTVVDLPGIYSIRPYTPEEIVTRDFILNQKPDGLINIVDATNIERNLYLTLQLMEMRIPMVLALNMMDEVTAGGGTIDVKGMSQALGIPVVPISAVKNQGVDELVKVAVQTARTKTLPTVYDFCSPGPVHRCIHAVVHQIEDHAEAAGLPVRFAATKLIEGDEDIVTRLALDQNELELIEHSVKEMEDECGMDRNAALADMRYTFIETICSGTVVKCRESRERARSEAIDRVVTNKYLALPLFFAIMLGIFFLTFEVIGAFLSDLLAAGIDALTAAVDSGLAAYGLNPVVHSLVIDGVFAGVGSVLSFLPIIVVLFFFLSILEDTGYMARVAFVMDQLLRKIGLSGRSIVPMLVGFGCSVPAIMSTRTLASERDRRMTILLTPFMSCSAKIPIYGVFSAAFFPNHAALVMIGLYILGILVGIVAAKVLGTTVYKGNPVPFVMELPNYRFPSAKSVWQLCWDKAKDFLTRAFTIIFVATIIGHRGCLDRPALRSSGLCRLAGLHCPHHRVHRKGVRHLHPWNPYRVRRGCQHRRPGDAVHPCHCRRVPCLHPAVHPLRGRHLRSEAGAGLRLEGRRCGVEPVRDCLDGGLPGLPHRGAAAGIEEAAMLEVLILAALGIWLALALRSCLRRRGKGCGGCDGCCDRCGGACRSDRR